MIRAYLVLGLLALAVFANAQYRGWSLFEHSAAAPSRVSSAGSRIYHK